MPSSMADRRDNRGPISGNGPIVAVHVDARRLFPSAGTIELMDTTPSVSWVRYRFGRRTLPARTCDARGITLG